VKPKTKRKRTYLDAAEERKEKNQIMGIPPWLYPIRELGPHLLLVTSGKNLFIYDTKSGFQLLYLILMESSNH